MAKPAAKLPADPKIAAAVSSLILALYQTGAFDRLGWSSDDVLYWGSVAAAVLTVGRAIWLHKWPPVAKADPTPAEVADEPTPSAGLTLIFPVLFLLTLSGCAGYSGPGLESVVGRIDIGKVLQCAKAPTPTDKARCLGVEMLSVGIDTALEHAAFWGEKALKAASGAGADDMSDRDRRTVARKADAALDELGAELAKAGAG